MATVPREAHLPALDEHRSDEAGLELRMSLPAGGA